MASVLVRAVGRQNCPLLGPQWVRSSGASAGGATSASKRIHALPTEGGPKRNQIGSRLARTGTSTRGGGKKKHNNRPEEFGSFGRERVKKDASNGTLCVCVVPYVKLN